MKKPFKYLTIFVFLLLSGCYNDNEENLYRFVQTNCDTSNVTYALTIAPIIQASCTSCHNLTNPQAGWTTNTYSGLRTIALNGKLMGVITQSSGFSPMPKGSSKLSDCKIAQIKKWIDSGTPNN